MSTPTDTNAANASQSWDTATVILRVRDDGCFIHVERWSGDGEFPVCWKGALRPTDVWTAWYYVSVLELIAQEADQF